MRREKVDFLLDYLPSPSQSQSQSVWITCPVTDYLPSRTYPVAVSGSIKVPTQSSQVGAPTQCHSVGLPFADP